MGERRMKRKNIFNQVGAGLGNTLVLLAFVGVLIGRLSTDSPAPPQRVLRLALDVPAGPKQTLPRVTPDGSALVHEIPVDRTPEGRSLFLRRFDSFEDVQQWVERFDSSERHE